MPAAAHASTISVVADSVTAMIGTWRPVHADAQTAGRPDAGRG
jgi:hypothetical protein